MAEGMTVRALLLSGAAHTGMEVNHVRVSATRNFFIESILPEP